MALSADGGIENVMGSVSLERVPLATPRHMGDH